MKLLRKFSALFRKGKLDAEMAEEMRLHLELQAEKNIAAGMDADEARYVARRMFGGVEQIKEQCRDQRRSLWLELLIQDFRFAARSLRRSPGYACAVLATLMVGVGLLTAIVDVARPILFPHRLTYDAENLFLLREHSPQGLFILSPYRFAEYARHAKSFTVLAGEKVQPANLVIGGEVYPVRMSVVTKGFLAAFRVSCTAGRAFVAEEYGSERAGNTVVLSHRAWTKFFEQDPEIVGKDIMLDGRVRRVVGVMEPGFRFRGSALSFGDGVYVSSTLDASFTSGGDSSVNAVGRIKPGLTPQQAEEELRAIRPEMPRASADLFADVQPSLSPLAEVFRENRAQQFRIFLGAALLLHLIGCTTVANLMLSRMVRRRRELGIRLALGGSRQQIARLLLAESLLLTVLGAGGSVLLAEWAQRLLKHVAPTGFSIDDLLQETSFPWTFGIALGISFVTCLLSTLAPVWRASCAKLDEALKEGAGALGDSRRGKALREIFVVAQSALAVALLIGAGLLIKTIGRLQTIDPGFDPGRKLAVVGNHSRAIDFERLDAINRAIVDEIAALPGVAKVALTSSLPGRGFSFPSLPVTIEGSNKMPVAHISLTVTPEYFETMGMPLIAGDGFAPFHRGDRPVAVINDVMAAQYFPNQNPVGRLLISGDQRIEIVGVVGSVVTGWRGTPARGGEGPIRAQIYIPTWQGAPLTTLNVIVRLYGQSDTASEAAIRQVVFKIDPSLVLRIFPLVDIIDDWSRNERRSLVMLQVLSALALTLAAFGTFSVTAFSVAQRTGELGVRVVLGATPGNLSAFVLRRGMLISGAGTVVGLALAWALSTYLQAMLYETSRHDFTAYVLVGLLMFTVSVLACWLPARRAAKVDPMVALRCE